MFYSEQFLKGTKISINYQPNGVQTVFPSRAVSSLTKAFSALIVVDEAEKGTSYHFT